MKICQIFSDVEIQLLLQNKTFNFNKLDIQKKHTLGISECRFANFQRSTLLFLNPLSPIDMI